MKELENKEKKVYEKEIEEKIYHQKGLKTSTYAKV